MERPVTPPRQAASSPRRAPSPPTPEVTRRIEENRLRAKAIRDQHESAARAAGASTLPHKTSSGFVATDDIQVVGANSTNATNITNTSGAIGTSGNTATTSGSSRGRKRPYADTSTSVTRSDVPINNRDARMTPANMGEDAPLRPARNFAKYVDYNFSTMTDTKGGFLSTEDDPHNYALGGGARKGGADGEQEKPAHMSATEWERKQLLWKLQRQKTGPFEPGMSALETKEDRKKCVECGSLEIDFVWDEVFNVRVCNACKEKIPEKYSLLTKTECKQDYLLTDPELKDAELLPHLSKPNPHKAHWHDMMLFLRCQVEQYAFTTKWGSAEALDAEFERRESDKRRRKEAKFKEKLTDLKRKTRTDAYRRQTKAGLAATGGTTATKFGDRIGNGGPHVHDWGRTVENEVGISVKTCLSCGMEVEELEF